MTWSTAAISNRICKPSFNDSKWIRAAPVRKRWVYEGKGITELTRETGLSGYGHSIVGRGLCVVRPPLPHGRGSDFCAAVNDTAVPVDANGSEPRL